MTVGFQTKGAGNLSVELKAGVFNLLKLSMPVLDPDAIDGLLCERVAKAPQFFHNTPVVIDLTDSSDEVIGGDLAVAVGAIRGYGLVPVGVRGGSKAFREQARLLELAVFPELKRSAGASVSKRATTPAPVAAPKVLPAKIIDAPVRSGQRIYAKDGDLVLLAPVSSGAEVVSDGHVHAYAPIRGRVLAGVKGDESACIFCKDLRAELISIAGRYKVSEDLESRFMGRFVSVSLKGDALIFRRL
jgi:septum site-determining protein MinC